MDSFVIGVHSGSQKCVAINAAMAEQYEVSRAVAVIVAYREFCAQIGVPQLKEAVIRTDSSTTVNTAESVESDKQSLFMKRRIHFIRVMQEEGYVKVEYISNVNNHADLMTKVLAHKEFKKFMHVIMRLNDSVPMIHATVHKR